MVECLCVMALLTTDDVCSFLMPSTTSKTVPQLLPEKKKIIRCSGNGGGCIYSRGLLQEMAVIKVLDSSVSKCSISQQRSASVTCFHCKSTQFVCTICNSSFDRRRNLIQHIKKVKSHSRLVKAISRISCNLCCQCHSGTGMTLSANVHLDGDLESVCSDDGIDYCADDDNADNYRGYDEPSLMNHHLHVDLESDSEVNSESDDESINEVINFQTKEALDRNKLIEDVKGMVMNHNSESASLEGPEELDLMDLRLIVGRALGMKDKSDCLRVHPVDAARHIVFTNLMESMTESKREDLLLLLQLNKVVKDVFSTSNKWTETNLSEDRNTLNKVNLKSPTSIKKSLNLNDVKHEFGGAYSDVRDSINSMMLQQGPLNSLQAVFNAAKNGDVSSIIECRRLQRMAREMWNEAILEGRDPNEIVPLFVFVWDDGFDNTAMKSGVGGLNMGTISILDLVNGDMTRLKSYTDVITLSRAADDQDKTIGRLLSQLEELRKPFKTFHKSKGEVYAMVRVVNVNRDRVQRNKVSGTLAHNGSSNQRWKYVLPPKGDQRQSFYSCDNCFFERVDSYVNKKVDNTVVRDNCSVCCDFDIAKNRNLQRIEINEKCPLQLLQGSPLPPPVVPISSTNRIRNSFKLSFKILRMAMKTATYHCVTEFWTEDQTKAYLKEVGINSSTALKVIKFKKANKGRDHDDIIAELEASRYSQVVPDVWQFDGVVDIDDNIDPLMHMLFEGIVKVMYKEVLPNSFALFNVDGKECLESIQKQLREIRKMSVSWIRTETLSNNKLRPTGWRGVDFVAAARLMKNCISHIKVAIKKKGGQHLESSLEKYELLEQFVCACHSMISRVMCNTCNDASINDVEEHIKMFLSASERYCKLVENMENKKTFMSMKGNFLSLLNIPDEMREYGPLRRYWDGDYEAFVKLIKEVLPGGLKRVGEATLVSKLRRFKERTSLVLASNTSKQYLKKKKLIVESTVYDRNKPLHVYKSLNDVELLLDGNHPISAVLVMDENNNQTLLVAYKVNSKKRIHEHSDQGHAEQRLNCLMVDWKTSKGKWIAGAWYVPFGVKERTAYKHTDISFSVIRRNQIRNVVLVPYINCGGNSNDVELLRCAISDDWTEMNERSEFKLTTVHKSTFPDMF